MGQLLQKCEKTQPDQLSRTDHQYDLASAGNRDRKNAFP